MSTCLKFRQLFLRFSAGLLVSFFLISCGKPINNQIDQRIWNNVISNMMVESNCLRTPEKSSQVFIDIMNFTNEVRKNNFSLPGNVLSSKSYDYLSPMIINEAILRGMLSELLSHYKNNSLTIDELNKLEEYAYRFEGMKCQFKNLSLKTKNDLRPYLNLVHQCYSLNKDDCDSDSLTKIFNLNDRNSEIDLLKLCESFDDKITCSTLIDMGKRKKSLPSMALKYLERFNQEKVNSLFLLRKEHSRFSCKKSDNNLAVELEIQNVGFDSYPFKEIVNTIESTWGQGKLKIHFTEVINRNKNTIRIVAINNGISHVDSDEPNTIFLNRNLDYSTLFKVAAHEFGHVLGFPDCYIEFYDEISNELVYYELSEENKNIMCSLKFGVNVEASYIQQLVDKSCNF